MDKSVTHRLRNQFLLLVVIKHIETFSPLSYSVTHICWKLWHCLGNVSYADSLESVNSWNLRFLRGIPGLLWMWTRNV